MTSKKLTGAFGALSSELDNMEPLPDMPAEAPPVSAKATNPKPRPKPASKPKSQSKPKGKNAEELVYLDPDRIRSWKYKDRQTSDLEGVEFDELVRSIANDKQQQPILVRPIKSKDYDYEEVFGFRRLHACRLLGIPVLARVENLDDQTSFKIQIVENDGRTAPCYWHRSQAFAAAMDENLFKSVEAMSARTGVSRSTIANYLRTARNMPEIFRDKLPLHECRRDALFYLMTLGHYGNDLLEKWINDARHEWMFDIPIKAENIKRSFEKYIRKKEPLKTISSVKRNGAKTYTGKAGKLFSLSRKGDQVTINVLKDGKRIMTDEEIAEVLKKAMDAKIKSE